MSTVQGPLVEAPPKIGHLVLGTVLKAYPNERASLLGLPAGGPLALLPHAEADRPVRVGETVCAAVSAWRPPYLLLSQRTIHYVRRIAELVWSPLRAEGRLALSRVAYQPGWPFAKVLAQVASEAALREAARLAPLARAYLTPRLIAVPREPDLLAQVRRALYPAPPELIQDVWPQADRTLVLVLGTRRLGPVLGPRGANLQAAAQLLRRRCVIITGASGARDAGPDPLSGPAAPLARVDSFPFAGAANGNGEMRATPTEPWRPGGEP